jgi:transcriptional regulator with XRE-family HTH domain
MATTKKPTRTLYLAEWIDHLKLPQKVIASRAGIGDSYLANLIRDGAARSPSAEVMLNLAASLSALAGLRIIVEDLYNPVPSEAVLDMRRLLTELDMVEYTKLVRAIQSRPLPKAYRPEGPRRRGPRRRRISN